MPNMPKIGHPISTNEVDPNNLNELEIVDHRGTYTCDSCGILYNDAGVKLMKWDEGGFVGYRMISYLCKWCLHKLAVQIMERYLGQTPDV